MVTEWIRVMLFLLALLQMEIATEASKVKAALPGMPGKACFDGVSYISGVGPVLHFKYIDAQRKEVGYVTWEIMNQRPGSCAF
jgi:hypothetical protein